MFIPALSALESKEARIDLKISIKKTVSNESLQPVFEQLLERESDREWVRSNIRDVYFTTLKREDKQRWIQGEASEAAA